MTVKESHEILVAQESDKMIEEDKIVQEAKKSTEDNGIVFLDEIDKVSARGDRVGGDVSREGVQRDLLPFNRRNNCKYKTWSNKNRSYFVYCLRSFSTCKTLGFTSRITRKTSNPS